LPELLDPCSFPPFGLLGWLFFGFTGLIIGVFLFWKICSMLLCKISFFKRLSLSGDIKRGNSRSVSSKRKPPPVTAAEYGLFILAMSIIYSKIDSSKITGIRSFYVNRIIITQCLLQPGPDFPGFMSRHLRDPDDIGNGLVVRYDHDAFLLFV